jgi:trk system potassium uptake protein TrkA
VSLTAVIGLGQLGEAVVRYLADHGAEVIAIDADISRVEAIKDRVEQALCLDATDPKALRAAGVADASTVVLALGETQLEQAVMTTMVLRELGVGRIISRAATDLQAKVLERIGVSRVIFPERQVGNQIARQILSPSLREMMPMEDGTSLAELEVGGALAGQTIGGAAIRSRYGLNVVSVRRQEDLVADDGSTERRWQVDHTPGPETQMQKGDIIVVVGADDNIRAFAEHA